MSAFMWNARQAILIGHSWRKNVGLCGHAHKGQLIVFSIGTRYVYRFVNFLQHDRFGLRRTLVGRCADCYGKFRPSTFASAERGADMTRTQTSQALDRLLTWSLLHPLAPPAQLIIASILLFVTAAFRAYMVTNLLPYLLFIPVVLVVTLVMGRATGLFSVWFSAFLAGLTIADVSQPGWLTVTQWAATLLYAVVMTAVTLVASELRAALQRSRVLTAELTEANQRLSEHEDQLRLVNQELAHRLKNQLAVVQAVASQTLRQSSSMGAANEALSFRLAALAQATDTLTAAEWRGADLKDLAATVLGSNGGLSERIHISGPAVHFDAPVSLGFTLTLHELMTNATKYGALSNDSGHVELHWSLKPGATTGLSHFHMVWRELGGPVVVPPSRRGFGSIMIERSLKSYLKGKTCVDYAPTGLVFEVEAPWKQTHSE